MNKVKMSKREFVEEHKNLIKTLLYGTKKLQKKEAKSQAKELKEKE